LSLRRQPFPPVPKDTKDLVSHLYPKGHPYISFSDEFANFLDCDDFIEMYSNLGQSAIPPARIVAVMLLQAAEGLSDRQAVAQLRQSVLWKYVASMELQDGGFDHSVLSEFRDRLIKFEAGQLLFDKMLHLAHEMGLLKTSKQRTDATDIHSAARLLNRSELIHECMRLCLDDLTEVVPLWLNKIRKPEWSDRYSLRPFNYKLGKTDKAKAKLAETLGEDALYLLELIVGQENDAIKGLDSVLALHRVFEGHFDIDDKGIKLREQLKPSGERLGSPHDVDARVGAKRGDSWLGYKKHLTETVNPSSPNLITNVLITQAHINDSLVLEEIHQSLKERGLKPKVHLVDRGYVQVDQLTKSLNQDEIDVVSYITESPSWQARAKQGFDLSNFKIDYESQTAICPAGEVSAIWKKRKKDDNSTDFNVVFSKRQCQSCNLRPQCTSSTSRILHIKSEPVSEFMRKQRERQHTPEFKRLYAQRSGIEGTISQDVRRMNSRRSRLRGLQKVQFSGFMQALAMNAVRLGAHLMGIPKATTRLNPFQMAFAAGT